MREWAGWRDESFWHDIALPIFQSSDAVAHCLIFLSALRESQEAIDAPRHKQLRMLSYSQGHKAIENLTRAKLSYFEALISCIIVMCLKYVQKCRSSFPLLRSGLRLLKHRNRHVSLSEESLILSVVDHLFWKVQSRCCTMSDLSVSFLLLVIRRNAGGWISSPTTVIVPLAFSSIGEAQSRRQRILDRGHDTVTLDQYHCKAEEAHLASSLQQSQRAWKYALDSSVALFHPYLNPSSMRRSTQLLN